MSAEIVQFPGTKAPPPALPPTVIEIVKEYLEVTHPTRRMARRIVGRDIPPGVLPDAEYFLCVLAQHGYVITKIED